MDLLINIYGTRIRSAGERIVLVFPKDRKNEEYAARRIEKIVILRPSSISTGAVRLAIDYGIDIVYLGSFGKPVGRIFPSNPKGLAQLRRTQLVVSTSPKGLEIAKSFVRGKTCNQVAYLKHLQRMYKKDFSKEIIQAETLIDTIEFVSGSPNGRDQLFGIEGYIADRYFFALKKLYRFPGRKPRGRDRFNSALNYGYGILYNEVERACLYVGLDPFLGLYHAERYGKLSLVFDLVEEFRVPIIDSMIFPLFIEKRITSKGNFTRIKGGGYQLSSEGKRKIVESVYTRLNQRVKWDGKQREVKKIIEHQVRSLARVFLGKKESYSPFTYNAVEND